MHDEKTVPDTIPAVLKEVRELKAHCQRIADNGQKLLDAVPKLEARMRRLELFQAWFPTAAITIAIVVRLVWLR